MSKEPFLKADGIAHQQRQLENWKLKLNERCYRALQLECIMRNTSLKVDDGYQVFRGESMYGFIANWKPTQNED